MSRLEDVIKDVPEGKQELTTKHRKIMASHPGAKSLLLSERGPGSRKLLATGAERIAPSGDRSHGNADRLSKERGFAKKANLSIDSTSSDEESSAGKRRASRIPGRPLSKKFAITGGD